jgi:hypothetical protein
MNRIDPNRLEAALDALGEALSTRREQAEIVVIGGSGLLLLGVVVRTTHDVDVVAILEAGELRTAEPLPAPLVAAATDVARVLGLSPDWLNSAPTALLDFGLPEGFLARCRVRRHGALVVHAASRVDQVHFKLYAAADHGPRSKHVSDLRALAPTNDELRAAARWCRTQDPSPAFAISLRNALAYFGVEVGDDDL